MHKKLKWIIPLALLVIVLAVYLWPVPQKSFSDLAAKVDPELTAQFLAFREAHPAQILEVDGQPWEYLAFGEGDETILFLHGMTGAADIWWRPMSALSDRYRVVAVTYPSVDSLEAMSRGALAVLDQLGVEQTNLVGSSLGGYFAQYLAATHPERVRSVVFANTFPPNEIIAEKNKTIGALLPYLPEWLVLNVLRGSFYGSVYPAAGNSELVLAYMLEQSYGRMSKAQVVGRFHGVIDPFTAPDVAALGIPVMIIEADNDPLVEEVLREQLKAVYPDAEVHTLHAVGHFPYLNDADEYIALLTAFFAAP